MPETEDQPQIPISHTVTSWYLASFLIFHERMPSFPISFVIDSHPFVFEKTINRRLGKEKRAVRNLALQSFQVLDWKDIQAATTTNNHPSTDEEIMEVLRRIV